MQLKDHKSGRNPLPIRLSTVSVPYLYLTRAGYVYADRATTRPSLTTAISLLTPISYILLLLLLQPRTLLLFTGDEHLGFSYLAERNKRNLISRALVLIQLNFVSGERVFIERFLLESCPKSIFREDIDLYQTISLRK